MRQLVGIAVARMVPLFMLAALMAVNEPVVLETRSTPIGYSWVDGVIVPVSPKPRVFHAGDRIPLQRPSFEP